MDKTIADQAVSAYMAMTDMTTAFVWSLKLNETELPTSQIAVLHELKHQGKMNLTQLAKQVSVAKQTMTDISTKLIKTGFVERIYDESNRRQIQLQLTPEGDAYMTAYKQRHFLYLRDQVFAALSEEQLLALRDACYTLCKLQNETLIGERFGSRALFD